MEIKSTPQTQAFNMVYEQHLENASFLWELLNHAYTQPHYYVDDLKELQDRIDQNIKGLLHNSNNIWPLCEATLELEGPGDIFITALVALHNAEHTYLQKIIDLALCSPEQTQGLVSAITWLPTEKTDYWLTTLLKSKNLDHKYLAIEACVSLRKNPGDYLNTLLTREDCLQHEKLTHSCLRLIGVLKLQVLSPFLMGNINSEDPQTLFCSFCSILILGPEQEGFKQALAHLRNVVLTPGPNQYLAVNLIFRVLPIEEGRALIKEIAKSKQQRVVVQAVSVLGDPHAIPWLLELIADDLWARVAAEAYAHIVGVNLENDYLDREAPSPQSEQDDPQEDSTEMDEDEHLPWPDIKKLEAHWQQNSYRFERGQRYFLGMKPSKDLYRQQIKYGSQRIRNIAALGLTLLDPYEPFFNTKTRLY